MSIDTVAVTGGSGFVGRATIEDLAEHGYRTANVDVAIPSERRADAFVEADLRDAGETYGALAACDADAVVHMGTIPNPLGHPAHVTYESNVMTSYHVLAAARALGLESAVLASSVNAIGRSFQDVPTDVRYLPIDEDHPATPRDPYGLAKRVVEVTADGVGRRPDPPRAVSTLRYPGVRSRDQLRSMDDDRSLADLRADRDPSRAPLFEYVARPDVASAVRLAVEADFVGHETFWVVADDTTVGVPTADLVDAFFPDVPLRAEFAGHESLVSAAKAREVLGWSSAHSWRDAT